MITLPDLLTRLQSQATGCIAVLLVDLRDGTVAASCGDDVSSGTVARVMRDLLAPQHLILPLSEPAAAEASNEMIVVSEHHTFVCRRLDDPPHHAVTTICRGTRGLGLVVSLLHDALMPKVGA